MERHNLDHQLMTNYQRQAFKKLKESGRPNTLGEHTKIAIGALEAGGATHEQALFLVAESLKNLRGQRVLAPTNIPWYNK